ncbi:MAG: hypothetical protein RL612_691 [Actinomycetota bacterium]|jgi:hypothetical protein
MEKKLSTKFAVAGAGVLALAGIAIASPALAASSTDTGSGTSSTAPSFGQGEGKRGHHGMGRGMNINATPQTVTVNVPTDGTYQLVVTEAAPTLPVGATPPTDANGKALPAPKTHSTAIALTGTGTQTVTLPPLHTGKFTLQLVKVSGTVINGEIGTDGKLIAPITVG